MLNLKATADAAEIGSYVTTAETLRSIPTSLQLPVAIAWLAKQDLISKKAAQEVFDALFIDAPKLNDVVAFELPDYPDVEETQALVDDALAEDTDEPQPKPKPAKKAAAKKAAVKK